MILKDELLTEVEKSKFHQNLLEGKVVLDNSEFTNWDGCFTKGIFGGALKKVPRRGTLPLVFGGAVHAAMEKHLLGADVKAQWEAAEAYAIEHNLHEVQDERRNLGSLKQLIIQYNLDYTMRYPQFKPIEVNGSPLVEASFLFPLGEITAYVLVDGQPVQRKLVVYWCGKIDLITEWDRGTNFIVDHKTTSVMGEKFTDDKQRSSQMLGYCWAGQQFFDRAGLDVKIGGVVINAIALRKNGFEFKVFTLPYAPWMVEEWREETLLRVRDLVDMYTSMWLTKHASVTREHCVTKYGKCPFFDVCQVHPNVRADMLLKTNEFNTSEWTPLD